MATRATARNRFARMTPTVRNKRPRGEEAKEDEEQPQGSSKGKKRAEGSTSRRRGPPGLRRVDSDSDEPPLAPEMPTDAAAVNVENHLDLIPMDLGRDVDRPWYYFDLVEPVAKFRVMDPKAPKAKTTDVPEDEGTLVDEPGPNTMPVEIMGYAQVFYSDLRCQY